MVKTEIPLRMDRNLKILYVNRTMHGLPHIGGLQRMFHIGRQLKKCGAVTMLGVNYDFNPEALELAAKEFERVELMKLKKFRTPSPTLLEMRQKYQMHWPTNYGDRVDHEDLKRFTRLSREHDVVWFSLLSAANCFGNRRFANSIVDLDDLMHVKFALRTQIDKSLRWRMSAHLQSFKWRRQEFQSFQRFNIIVLCSTEDKQVMGNHRRIRIVPNGFPSPANTPIWTPGQEGYLGFIGTLSYGPNVEGLEWFRDRVWPAIRKEMPQATLRLVGTLPKNHAFLNVPGFEPLGFVEDPTEEFSRWQAMIVPLRYGGGTRLKILEAFSRKCPVISTPIGAHGLQVTPNQDILLEENPQAFAHQCLRLLKQPHQGKTIAEAGWELFNRKYTWDVIGKSIQNIVAEIARKRSRS